MGKKAPHSPDIEAARHWHPPPGEQWMSWLVPVIFVSNIGMFVYTMYLNDCPDYLNKDSCLFSKHLGRFSFQPFRENPLLGPSTRTLRILGALEEDGVLEKHQAWRFFTCMFLHAGVVHVVANMFSLLFIGIRLEEEFGFLRIGALYLLSGFGGGLLSLIHLKNTATSKTISVGASGALFGLLGAMLSELLTNWTIYANKCAALISLLIIIGLNLAVGFLPHVDNSAHIGGFLAGFFLGFVLLMRPQYGYVSRKYVPAGCNIKHKAKYKCYQYFFMVSSVIILLIGYAYCLARLYIGKPEDFSFLKKSPR
ncbi:RHOMBOID-like protein 5 [Arachis duranensis]|uniref:RHOMBOID-like protein n=1 Tax=Arachis duranensis TaxID=130453 RepID=A0A6P5ML80_ARADU|nr:RHOMBOID-like protein 5 [Arachis duranensis]XP_057724165.1 RHOMBOID-like protein 5 [Arachis stenosperma]